MGRLTVSFEKTPLREVMRNAGGVIAHQGDAGESVYWLCYTIVEKKHSERLSLTASGEMGGPDQTVSSVVAEMVTDQPTADCPALAATFRPVHLSNGIWLGKPESVLIEKVGVPPSKNGEWRGFLYEGKQPGPCEPDGYDVENWLEWKSNRDSIVSIVAGQVTSC
jgi:hypothetical protein